MKGDDAKYDEFGRIREAMKLALKWIEQSDSKKYFMPDEEGDKIARTRTGACGRELLKVLSGYDNVYL